MKKGQVTIFMILGLVILCSFLLLLFINGYLVSIIQIDQSLSFESQICDDASIIVEFLRIENYGAGNVEEIIIELPFETEYFDGEEIPLLFESDYDNKLLLDDLFLRDYPGIILEQGNQYVNFILEGSQNADDVEIVDFMVYFENSLVEIVVDDDRHPLENQGDGIYEDSPNQDEVTIVEEENMVEAHLRVSSQDDGFYLYYSCLGIED